jgi:hypothetical protein
MSSILPLILLLLLVEFVSSTHFRYGVITWDQIPGGIRGLKVRFTIQSAFRRTFFTDKNISVEIGKNVLDADRFYPCEGCKSIRWNSSVQVVNRDADWFIGIQNIEYEYQSPGTYTAYFTSCCRISTLINNADKDWRVSSLVVVASQSLRKSMKSSAVPITTLYLNQKATFSLGILSYNNLPIQYRIASGSEAMNEPLRIAAPLNFTIDRNSGIMQWTPKIQGLYTVQIIASEIDPNSKSVISYMAIDWILNVVPLNNKLCKRFCLSNPGSPCSVDKDCGGCPVLSSSALKPYCDFNSPPYFTEISFNGKTFSIEKSNSFSGKAIAYFGEPFELLITAKDDDSEDFVRISTNSLPLSSTFQVENDGSSNSPKGKFSWFPDEISGGAVICFISIDSIGQSSIGSICVTIELDRVTLNVYGKGLNSAIAGARTCFQVKSSVNRNFRLDLIGYKSGELLNIGQSTRPKLNLGEYQMCYQVNSSEVYALKVSDSSLQNSIPVYSTLIVLPNITNPVKSRIYDDASTGWSGGISKTVVFFNLQAFDSLDNIQSQVNSDYFFFTIQFDLTAIDYEMARIDIEKGIWRGNYSVPSSTSGVYSICVKYKKSRNEFRNSLISCKELITQMTLFSIKFNQTEFKAGEMIRFTFEASRSKMSISSALIFGISAKIQAISDILFTIESSARVTKSGIFPNAIEIYSPGLVDRSYLLKISALDPNPDHSQIYPSDANIEFAEIIAGISFDINVILIDSFDNLCEFNLFELKVLIKFSDSEKFEIPVVRNNGIFTIQDLILTKIGLAVLEISAISSKSLQSIQLNPVSIVVSSGEFSLRTSSYTLTRPNLVGVFNSFIITSRDQNGNPRAIKDGDVFYVSLIKDHGRNIYEIPCFIVQDRNVLQNYIVSFSTNVSGIFKLNAFVGYKGARIKFIDDIMVEILPSELSFSKFYGNGIQKALVEQTNVDVIIQSFDQYSNPIMNDKSGWNFVENQSFAQENLFTQLWIARVSHSKSSQKFYQSVYCAPNSAKCAVPPTSENLVLNYNEEDYSNLVNEEFPLYSQQGFFRISYSVPRIRFENSTFQINLYLANKLDFQNNSRLIDIVESNSAILMTSYYIESLPIPEPLSFAAKYKNYIFLGLAVSLLLLIFSGLLAWKLYTFRPKYHDQKEKADEAETILEEIEAEGFVPGGRDYTSVGAAIITRNVLHEANAELVELEAFHKEFNPARQNAKKLNK